MKKFNKSIEEEEEEEEELQIGDPEGFRHNKDAAFSHQEDVARAIRRVLETGSVEMKPGFTDFKKDKNSGELLMSKYHADTREMFIESVNSFYDICIAEIEKNPKYKKLIDIIIKKKEDRYKHWAVQENKYWKTLDYNSKKDVAHIPGSISKKSHFYSHFMIELVSISRELARSLNLLLDNLKYWKAVDAEN